MWSRADRAVGVVLASARPSNMEAKLTAEDARRALTDEQVAEVREKYATGLYALSTLGAYYHCSEQVIYRAVKGHWGGEPIRRPQGAFSNFPRTKRRGTG